MTTYSTDPGGRDHLFEVLKTMYVSGITLTDDLLRDRKDSSKFTMLVGELEGLHKDLAETLAKLKQLELS